MDEKQKFIVKNTRTIVEEKEVEYEFGDLVMLVRMEKESEKLSSVCIGILGGFEEPPRKNLSQIARDVVLNQEVNVIRPYHLKPLEILGGVELPIFEPRYGESHNFKLRGDIEIYLGKTEITEKLREMPGFEWYASWVIESEELYIKNGEGVIEND